MAVSRENKQSQIAEYTDKIKRAQAAYITDYRGLSVAEIGGLRADIRKDGGDAELEIAKNTLLRIAFEKAGWPVPTQHLEGPTAVLLCYSDPVSPAKVITRYAKRSDKFHLKGGVVGQSILDAKGVESMSELPSREEIRATLVGTLQAPAQNLVGLLTAPMREIAQVLHARSEQAAEA